MTEASTAREAPLIGGHAGIDFLNTSFTPEGEAIETIGDARSFVSWLIAAGLIGEHDATRLIKRYGIRALDSTAAEARKIREWARAWLLEWRTKPKANYSEELVYLNKLLARSGSTHEVRQTDKGLTLIERPNLNAPEDLITLIAMPLATLITSEDPSLIKTCAGEKCSLWFVDRTKAHRRLFCSASACGNRAKVAAFRQRQKA